MVSSSLHIMQTLNIFLKKFLFFYLREVLTGKFSLQFYVYKNIDGPLRDG